MANNRGRPEFNLYTLVGIGAINVGSLLTGLVVGWLVDGRTGTFPVGTLVGLLIGIIVGLTASWLRIRDYFTQTHQTQTDNETDTDTNTDTDTKESPTHRRPDSDT